MMGPKQEAQAALFCEFSLEDHVPQDHLLRSIDRFADLSNIRQYLSEFYSHTSPLSIDPDLLIQMLLVGYASVSGLSAGCPVFDSEQTLLCPTISGTSVAAKYQREWVEDD